MSSEISRAAVQPSDSRAQAQTETTSFIRYPKLPTALQLHIDSFLPLATSLALRRVSHYQHALFRNYKNHEEEAADWIIHTHLFDWQRYAGILCFERHVSHEAISSLLNRKPNAEAFINQVDEFVTKHQIDATRIRIINLVGCVLESAALARMMALFQNVVSLNFSNISSFREIEILQTIDFSKIRYLDLRYSSLAQVDVVVTIFSRCTQVTELNLSCNSQLSDDDIGKTSALQSLTSLNLQRTDVTTHTLNELCKSLKLSTLTVSGCTKIEDDCGFLESTTVCHLHIQNIDFTVETLAALARNFPILQTLSFTLSCEKAIEPFVQSLSSLQALRELNIQFRGSLWLFDRHNALPGEKQLNVLGPLDLLQKDFSRRTVKIVRKHLLNTALQIGVEHLFPAVAFCSLSKESERLMEAADTRFSEHRKRMLEFNPKSYQ